MLTLLRPTLVPCGGPSSSTRPSIAGHPRITLKVQLPNYIERQWQKRVWGGSLAEGCEAAADDEAEETGEGRAQLHRRLAAKETSRMAWVPRIAGCRGYGGGAEGSANVGGSAEGWNTTVLSYGSVAAATSSSPASQPPDVRHRRQ